MCSVTVVYLHASPISTVSLDKKFSTYYIVDHETVAASQ